MFATAYDQYAVRAFDQGAADYILKPFSEDRVCKSVQRIRETLCRREGAIDAGRLRDLLELIREREDPLTRLPAEKQGHIILLKPTDIVYCKAEGRKVLIFAHDETYIRHAPSSLDELEENLQHFAFLRTLRAFLVNPAHVLEVIPWFHGRDRASAYPPPAGAPRWAVCPGGYTGGPHRGNTPTGRPRRRHGASRTCGEDCLRFRAGGPATAASGRPCPTTSEALQ